MTRASSNCGAVDPRIGGFAATPGPPFDLRGIDLSSSTRTASSSTSIGDSPADDRHGALSGARLVIGVRSGIGRDEDLGAADAIVDSVADLG